MNPRNGLFGRADRVLARTASAVAVGAGAGLVGLPSTAQAGIVYSGTINIPIPVTTDGVYLNVVTGQTDTTGSFPGYDVNPFSGSGLSFFAPTGGQHGSLINGTGGTSAFQVDNLAPGFEVNGTFTFGTNNAAENAGPTAFVFNSSANYIGFRFLNENTSTVNFGWMQIQVGATFTDPARAIVGYAYEDTGAPINVAAVPEPSSMALLAFGSAGLVAYRRRKSAPAKA